MSFLVAERRARRVRADGARGARARRRRRRATSTGSATSTPRRRGRVPRGGDRRRHVGPAGRHPARPRPASRSRSSRRTPASAAPGSRTATRAAGSTSATTSTATRSRPTTSGPSSSPSSPSSQALLRALLRPTTAWSTTSASRPRSSAPRGTTTPRRWIVARPRAADGDDATTHRRHRRHQRGRPAQPAQAARHRRASTRSPAWPCTRPSGSRHRPRPASGSPSIGTGASAFQIVPTIAARGRARHRVPALGAVDVPQPELPRRRSAPACRGRSAHLPYYGRWYRFLLFWPACDGGLIAMTDRPRLPAPGPGHQRDQRRRPRDASPSGCVDQVGDDAELLGQGRARLRVPRQAHAPGQRQLARRAHPRRTSTW